MKFPIIDISTERWDEDNLMEYIAFDKFIYRDKESLFKELFKDKFFCDCNGEIFRAVKKAELNQKWRTWFRFIPNVWKREVIYEATGKTLTVDELRNVLLNRVSQLRRSEYRNEWMLGIKNAKSHSELIHGK